MPNDVLQLRAIGSDLGGNQWECGFYYESDSAGADPDPFRRAKELIDAWSTANEANFLLCIPNSVILHYYACRRVNNLGGNTFLKPNANAGTFAQPAVAIGLGAQLKFITALPRVVGKVFLPGIAVGMFEDDHPDPAYVATLGDFNNSLATPILAGGINYTHVVWGASDKVRINIVDYGVAEKPGAQRKRMVPIF